MFACENSKGYCETMSGLSIIKTFFMLNSTEHEISIANILKKKRFFSCLKHSDAIFILLINVKMPTTIGILSFMSRINFLFS